MGALKQQRIDIPYYCRRCKELLGDGQMVCPFCDNDAVPIDDLAAIADGAEKLACTVKRIYAEQLPGTWFVCGESTIKDANGLPAHIYVCPAYGADWIATYGRLDTSKARGEAA